MNYALWFSSSYQHYWIYSIIKHFCWKWQTIRDLLCSNLFADTACLISEAAGVLFDDTCIIIYDGIKCATTCYWLRFDNNFKIIERKIWGKKSQMFLYERERERERESIISYSRKALRYLHQLNARVTGRKAVTVSYLSSWLLSMYFVI